MSNPRRLILLSASWLALLWMLVAEIAGRVTR